MQIESALYIKTFYIHSIYGFLGTVNHFNLTLKISLKSTRPIWSSSTSFTKTGEKTLLDIVLEVRKYLPFYLGQPDMDSENLERPLTTYVHVMGKDTCLTRDKLATTMKE